MHIVKNKNINLIIISFCVFLFINLLENLIHYNIGRHRDKDSILLTNPSKKDWIKIAFIMVIFAILQGLLTFIFNYYF